MRLCFLLLTFCFLGSALSQTPADFVFTHYGTHEGLAANELYKVQQDREGYLWIGTNNGLQRYDGIRFRNFEHKDGDPASLPSNVVTRLYLDKKDVLWGATWKAEFFQFDKARFTCKRIPVRALHPETMLTSETMFVPDLDGHLFVLTMGNELLAYDEKRGEFSHEANFIPLPKDKAIIGLAQQPGTKKYWIGLFGGGIAIYNHATGNISTLGHNVEHEPAVDFWGAKNLLLYPFFDNQGRLWSINWGPGIPLYVRYNLSTPAVAPVSRNFYARIETYHELNGFLQQRDGRMWIKGLATLAYYDERLDDFVLIKSNETGGAGIRYESINSLFEDRESNVWVGTNNNGLYRFNPSAQAFSNVLHPRRFVKNKQGAGAVMSFAELVNGNLLVGTWEDALFQYTTDVKPLPLPAAMPYLLKNAYLWSMCPSADGNTIWMGAQPGFWEYDQRTGGARFHSPPELEKRTVRQVAEDNTGVLWLGMHNFGLFRCVQPKRAGRDSVVRVPGPGTTPVNKIVADRKGRVWVATGDKGLFVYEAAAGRLVHHYNAGASGNDSCTSLSVTSVVDYNDSLVFVADESRLYAYNRRTQKLRMQHVLGNVAGAIASMEKDADGFLWVSTTNALYRGHPFQKAAMKFDRQDGILNDQFVLASSYRLRDGRLLFGTTNSFVVFDPKRAAVLPQPPVVHITSLQIGQDEVPVDSVMRLRQLQMSARNSALGVEFSALRYTEDYLIQYKMEGIDNDWRFADADGKVFYPLLPPSRYRLLLRTYEAAGNTSPVTELHIVVRPPWYQTWWFYTLAAVLFVTELWWLDRQRSRRKEALQKMRTDIATGLHDEVNTALNNINILSEIARLKSDREPQKAKDYLEQIHAKSQNMMVAMDDMLWSLDPDNDAMHKTISRIREYADALTQRHGAVIELLIDKKVEKMELNMKLRHEAFLLFKEGLRSLVEAGTKLCVVHLTADRGKLLFTIEFENEGCDMQQLNNLLHRRDMELRLEALKAKLDVQVHKSRSVFLLQLPLA